MAYPNDLILSHQYKNKEGMEVFNILQAMAPKNDYPQYRILGTITIDPAVLISSPDSLADLNAVPS